MNQPDPNPQPMPHPGNPAPKPGEVADVSGRASVTSPLIHPGPRPGDGTGGAWFPANASPVPRLINERLRGAW